MTEKGQSSREVATELDICIDALRSWLKSVGIQASSADRTSRETRRVKELVF